MTPPPVIPADILRARRALEGIVHRTPLERSAPLSALAEAEVFLKLEVFQQTGSFKVRGAVNRISQLSPAERGRGLVTASAGNHALGVAHGAALFGAGATIVLPAAASAAKVAALKRYPVDLVLHGENYDAAEGEARRLERDRGLTYVSSYNDPGVVAGQGTIAIEVLEDRPDLDAILVPVGGGGLIAGIAVWCKGMHPAIRVTGVQSEASPAMHAARQAGRMIPVAIGPSLADGLAGNLEPDTVTFPLIQRYVDDIALVAEADIARAIAFLLDEHHLVVEGAGAVGVAALLAGKAGPVQGRKVAVVLSGRNIATRDLVKLLVP